MAQSIEHENEPRGNAIRARLDAINGRGQRTFTPTQVVIASAKGARLWTVDGHELIDFTSGVLVSNLGHSHALFEERYRHYCAELPRTSYNMVTEIEVEAAERLVRCMDMPGQRKVLWAASGSEGIQKAMWCALHKKPDCPIMLATRGGFHGKKGLAGDVSGESSPNPNVRFISFPMKDDRPASFYENELDTVARECGGRIALLITEPYLGAKGSWHPPQWYHKLLQDWCRAHDVAVIFDEVQSCHGRTGNMFAYQSYCVEPDLVVLGKGLANGEPAAAVVGRADLIDSLTYGEASDTFSGNPHACAAVCATLDVFEKEGVVEHCRAMAQVIGEKLRKAMDRFSFINDVRGEGLVYGIEMADDATAQSAVLEAYRGANGKGVHFLGPLAGKVLRVSPPLTITEAELDAAFAVLDVVWSRL
ncbi:MAG: aspartate aminotransferase family protein [Candidatus Hydrogenedentes bacterium]|nr:aspartate aminotransferase family protein [Candidatus Hydrogenedentota bacterium]